MPNICPIPCILSVHLFPAAPATHHRKVHVQSLARNKAPEELAYELVQVKEQLYTVQEQYVSRWGSGERVIVLAKSA